MSSSANVAALCSTRSPKMAEALKVLRQEEHQVEVPRRLRNQGSTLHDGVVEYSEIRFLRVRRLPLWRFG